MQQVDISVVIPVYKGADSLNELYERLKETLEKITQNFEIILVDDCSPDHSFKIIKEIYRKDLRVRFIRLMRNFGQHNAIMCGFNHAQGDYVITIDDDLQNPPEEISKLLNKIEEGFDAVIGRPTEKKHVAYRNFGSFLVGKSYKVIFGKPKDIKMSSFRVLRRELVEAIIKVKTPNPMVDALILCNTLNIANVDVKHAERRYGKSNYSPSRSVKLALDLLVNYSTIPLRIISLNGFVFSLIGLLVGIYVIIMKLFGAFPVEGWTSVISLLSIFSGVILMSFGVVGEYLARIIGEVAYFRQYVIRESSFTRKNEEER